jgi:hypothetical protein
MVFSFIGLVRVFWYMVKLYSFFGAMIKALSLYSIQSVLGALPLPLLWGNLVASMNPASDDIAPPVKLASDREIADRCGIRIVLTRLRRLSSRGIAVL